MRNAKKALLLALCALLLVGASIMGTLAYLTDTESVTNTFTVGNVAITLQEYAVDAQTGKKTATVVSGLTDIELVPGRVIEKNPFIKVTGSESCWLIVKVENGLEGAGTLAWNSGWKNITGTNYWIYQEAVAPSDTPIDVFTNFTCFTNLDNAALANFAGKTIVVTAYAIQEENVSKDNALAYLKTQLNIQ